MNLATQKWDVAKERARGNLQKGPTSHAQGLSTFSPTNYKRGVLQV